MSAIYQNGVWYAQTGVHSGFTPVGTVISVMGVTAPMNYLACEGQVVNISEYPELALYFETQFGDKNHFGGDGVVTFSIPDLRGEFLRGTGENGHADQGSGADVGEHQDGTVHANLYFNNNGNLNTYFRGESGKNNLVKPDFVGPNSTSRTVYNKGSTATSYMNMAYGTSRPTNTSVLYCIATKNIFMDAGSNYSTEEQVVGTWIDGKPIYQKTYVSLHNGNPSTTSNIIIIDISDIASEIENTVKLDVNYDFDFNGARTYRYDSSYYYQAANATQSFIWSVQPFYNRIVANSTMIHPSQTLSDFNYYATLRYTKTTD